MSKELTQICNNSLHSNEALSNLCSETCPKECEVVDFDVSILQKSWTKACSNSTVRLLVYFENLGLMQFSEVPKKTFSDLLSMVGGSIGLFFGLSFLGLFEIFELAIKVFWVIIRKKSKTEQYKANY